MKALRHLFPLALASSALAAPTVVTTNPAVGTNVPALQKIQITFSEAVTNVDASDLLINAEAATGLTGSGAGPYEFSFTQPTAGAVSVSWDFDHGIAAVAGTGAFEPGAGWTYQLSDTIAPTIGRLPGSGSQQDALAPAAGSTVSSLTQVEVTFSEAVREVDFTDLRVNGVAATAVTGSGAGPYVFQITQPAAGVSKFEFPTKGTTAIVDNAGIPFEGASWTVTLAPTRGSVQLTEILAANAKGLKDEDGDTADWLELFNPGPEAVNLAGWSLSNDPERPDVWVLPARELAAGARLVVFATSKDRKPESGNWHANFTLEMGGGYLALFGPETPRKAVAVLNYPAQRYDTSYGLTTNGEARYFASPTPSAENAASGLTKSTPAPSVSVGRGFFNEPFDLILSGSDPGATIRYTLDGTAPTESSPAYSAPLKVTTTTLLRAAAYAPDQVPSEVVTHSYIYLDHALNQPSPPYDNPARDDDNTNPPLPKIGDVTFPVSWGTRAGFKFPDQIKNLPANIVPADYGMDPEVIDDPNKYDDNGQINAQTGITNLERIKRGLRELPLMSIVMNTEDMFGARGLYPNSLTKGVGQEKACSIELLMPDGTTGFATNCGIRIHGNASREPNKCPKHGFKLNFKGAYGANSLNYRLFPDLPAENFDDLILRGDFNTSWLHWDGAAQRPRGTRMRDAFSKDTFRDMGRAAGHQRYVHLFINGLYWGAYDPTEQENNDFASKAFGGGKDDYDVVEQGTLKAGNFGTYSAMTRIAAPIDNPKYEQMKQLLDVPWYIDYMLLHFWVGHTDWGDDVNKNWYAVKAKNGGKYRFLPWDMENLMFGQTDNRVTVTAPAGGMHPKLVSNAQYKLDFADRVQKHLVAVDGALTTAASTARWNKWRAVLQNSIAAESARWGDYRRDVHRYDSGPFILSTWHDTWMKEQVRLTGTWFPQRPNILLGQLRQRGLYPSVNAPEFHDNSERPDTRIGSQHVSPGTLVSLALPPAGAGTTSNGTIYYTTDGSDPRVYYDTTGQRTPTAKVYADPIIINESTILRARALDGVNWSALAEATFTVGSPIPSVRFTEIFYNPRGAQGGAATEFIELRNAGKLPVDMSAWSLKGVDYLFPWGSTLGAGDVLVLASNNAPNTFATRFPGVAVAGYFAGSLDNAGERLTLVDRAGRTVTTVEYGDKAPWPVANGMSIEVVNASGDPQSASNWQLNGSPSPGASKTFAVVSTVRISEFCAGGNAAEDYVELQNINNGLIFIGGWTLLTERDGVSFKVPDNTLLQPNAYFVIRLPEALTDDQGELTLLNSTGSVMDSLRYGWQAPNLSFGLLDGVWRLNSPTPGDRNKKKDFAGPETVRLSEWLANPVPGEDDWLEVAGATNLPIVLTGLHVGVNGEFARVETPMFMDGKGFARIFLDRGSKRGDTLPLQLPAEGATIQLADENGRIFDSVTYGPQRQGVSEGRPDISQTRLLQYAFPTPGATNESHSFNPNGPVFQQVLVHNATGATAPWGRRASWLEIAAFNNKDLSNVELRTLGPSPRSWKIPAGTKTPTERALLVWCDPAQPASAQTGANLNSGLDLTTSWGVEFVGGGAVDRLTWGKLPPDLALAREPVALLAGRWRLTEARQQFGGATIPLGLVSAIRINEWYAARADSQPADSFVELYNPGDAPVDLGGLWLGDEPSELGRRKWQVPGFTFIAAKGFLTLTTNGPAGSPTRINFDVARGGEYLRLSQNDEVTTSIDTVNFGYLTKALGRLPDGSNNITSLFPTPGAANRVDEPQGGAVTFAQWSAKHGVTDLNADDDGDGIRNLLEFLANSNPKSAATSAERAQMRMTASLSQSALTLEIGLDRNVTYKELTGEVSSTLRAPWTVLTPLGIEYVDGGRAKLRFNLPAGDRQFVRLKVAP